MKFTIINQHTLNYGDDIAAISLIETLIEKFGENTVIDIIYNTKGKLAIEKSNIHHLTDVTLKKMGLLNILLFVFTQVFHIPFNRNEAVKKFKKSILNSNYVLVSPCGANIGIYQDWRFLIKLLLVVLLGKRPVFHNNTIGKSGNYFFNKLAFYVLRHSDLYVREKESLEFLAKKNLFAIRSVDTGFLFNNHKSFCAEEEYMLFIPTQLDNWHPDFKNKNFDKLLREKILKHFSEFCKEKKCKMYILPHLYGNQKEQELLKMYRRAFIEYGLDASEIKILKIEDCYDYDNYIKYAQFVVSMRYHGVVMSIKNKTNFLSLAYENKMEEVCSYSDMKKNNIYLQDICQETFIDFNKLIASESTMLRWQEKVDYLKGNATLCLNQLVFREDMEKIWR